MVSGPGHGGFKGDKDLDEVKKYKQMVTSSKDESKMKSDKRVNFKLDFTKQGTDLSKKFKVCRQNLSCTSYLKQGGLKIAIVSTQKHMLKSQVPQDVIKLT